MCAAITLACRRVVGRKARKYVYTDIQFLWLAIPHIVCYNKRNYSVWKNITERGLTKMKNSATILSVSQSRVTLPASFVNTFLKKYQSAQYARLTRVWRAFSVLQSVGGPFPVRDPVGIENKKLKPGGHL